MVTFNARWSRNNRRPTYLGLELFYTANELAEDEITISRKIAGVLKDEVIREVSAFNNWSRQRTLQRTVGALNAISASNSKTYDGIVRLVDIDGDYILKVFEMINDSNDTLEITDLSWGYYLSPESIIEGGVANFPIPPWVNSRNNSSTWENHEFEGVPINCAAYALYCAMAQITYGQESTSAETLLGASSVQRKLKWGSFVTFEELSNFVNVYPKYKLSILIHKVQQAVVYVGNDYKYNSKSPKSNIIYLFFYYETKYDIKHYALVGNPMVCFKKRSDAKWCYFCDKLIFYIKGHECAENYLEVRHQPKHPKVQCGICKQYYQKYSDKRHLCFGVTCKTCFTAFKTDDKEFFKHRCPLVYEAQNLETDYCFMVYDLESRFEAIRTERDVIASFQMDDNGYYLQEEPEKAVVYSQTIDRHHANLVCLKDINTNQEWSFSGDNCLQDFIIFCLNHNDGKCVLLAHNASGYDARLVLDAAKVFVKDKIHVIMRGSKVLQLKIKDLLFRDIMLHIPGSVKGLAKDFNCKGRKGDFPFMFNRLENYNYIGPIPGLEYFSLQNCRTDKDREELLKWHSEFKGDWCFNEQLLAYCKNDVSVSTEIAKAYHDVWVDKGLLPWLKPTGPGVVNLYMGLQAWQQFCDKNDKQEETKWHSKENYEWLQKTDFKNTWWTICSEYEHFFSKAALRGGRTEVRRMYYKLTDEDRIKGRKILYVDVCSMYPYQQIVHDFPVGAPTIYFFGDPRFAGCNIHPRSVKCDCDFKIKVKSSHIYSFQDIYKMPDISTWFGFVCVTLKPPKNLLHPLIVYFDEEKVKCIASLRDSDHVEIVIGTNTLQMCLKHGYEIIKVNYY